MTDSYTAILPGARYFYVLAKLTGQVDSIVLSLITPEIESRDRDTLSY